MNFFIDFHPNEYQNFKKDCVFFEQHYIFSERTGSFEKIPVGHCSLNGRKDCNGCENCRFDKGICKADLFANQQMLLSHVEEHLAWMEGVIKNIYKNAETQTDEDCTPVEENQPTKD